MDISPAQYPISTLPSAFAAACRDARSDAELFERCREALVRRFHSDLIWLVVSGGAGVVSSIGTAEGRSKAVEVARIKSGETEVVIWADPVVAQEMRGVAMPLALGLSIVLELRAVLLERQAALDDATFQLRALRQVTRLLSSVHSTEETEQLVMDFIAEVFFAWWACLYRPENGEYVPKTFRALNEDGRPEPLNQERLDLAFPIGSGVIRTEEVALAALVDPRTKVLISLEAGTERLAVLALGARISGKGYGLAEFELAGTLSFAAAIALKNALLVEQLHSAATTDALTGLYNRRAVEQRLDAEISRANRHQLTTTIVLIDLDRFKQVNDSLGHAGGDRLLVIMAEILRQQCRTLDAVGRLGGDEFLVILPMTSPEEAMVFVGRVLSDIKAIEASHPEFGRQSVSLGVAAAPRHGATLSSLLASADVALYKAKNSGRNAVEFAEDR
ncbi:MAG: GGDEF domain-containing protein [Gemmatimonadota bacterium]